MQVQYAASKATGAFLRAAAPFPGEGAAGAAHLALQVPSSASFSWLSNPVQVQYAASGAMRAFLCAAVPFQEEVLPAMLQLQGSISLRQAAKPVQVQYAASEATRAFLRAAAPFREEVLPALLPAMCFNRHATAEGLRAFSQQTWVEAMGDAGRSWVARCIGEVGRFGDMLPSFSSGFRVSGCVYTKVAHATRAGACALAADRGDAATQASLLQALL